MLRVFLVLLAILLAVLAFVFDRSWLYGAAGLPLVGALALVGWQMWTRYRQHQRREPTRREENEPEEDLEEFGIVDVRPEDAEDASAPTPTSTAPEEPAAATPTPADSTGDPRTSTPSSNPAPPPLDHPAVSAPEDASEEEQSTEPPRASSEEKEDGDPAIDASSDDTGLSSLLASARAALRAQTVCLLVQEDVTLEYRIEACASVASEVQTTGTFETKRPLLSASMSRQSVAVQSLDDETRSALGYYRSPPTGRTQMAVAPVQRPDDPATIFLLADADESSDLASSRARRLLEHYAEMADLLLDSDPPAPLDAPEGGEAPLTASRDGADDSKTGTEDDPPPRRTIIAEEMEAAQATADDLALALVHLNRAESIARRGEDTVATTERRLQARLEQEVPGQRIERFGELTYGIFLRGDAEEAEQWAVALQNAMADETGALEGGVSVGVAVRGGNHTEPERLRADATEALREAYETGTCTIVA